MVSSRPIRSKYGLCVRDDRNRAVTPSSLQVEVGTHLGHVADGLLSRFPRLHYVGTPADTVDPQGEIVCMEPHKTGARKAPVEAELSWVSS